MLDARWIPGRWGSGYLGRGVCLSCMDTIYYYVGCLDRVRSDELF